MPALSSMTELGLRFRDAAPTVFRDDPDHRAVWHVYAREFDRLYEKIEEVRDQFFPQRASLLLGIYERLLKLPVEPSGASIDERRNRVLVGMRSMAGDPSGSTWQARLTELIGPGWTHLEHQPAADLVHNYCPEPGFEAPLVGWGAVPGGVSIAQSTLVAWRGAHSGQLTAPGPEADIGAYIDLTDAGLLALDHFSVGVKVWTYTAGYNMRVRIEQYDAGSTMLVAEEGDVVVSPAGGWSTVKYEGSPVLAGAATIKVMLMLGNASGAAVLPAGGGYLDDVMVNGGMELHDYRDGSSAGWTWAGTPNASVSEQFSPPVDTIYVYVPFPTSSDLYGRAKALLDAITPAHLAVVLTSTYGFELDSSQLDQQTFGA